MTMACVQVQDLDLGPPRDKSFEEEMAEAALVNLKDLKDLKTMVREDAGMIMEIGWCLPTRDDGSRMGAAKSK